MPRLALAAVLVAAALARAADDDDGLLETHPLGQPIPERLERLERDWTRDVGAAEPESPDAEPTDPAHEEDDEGAPPPRSRLDGDHDDEDGEALPVPRVPPEAIPPAPAPAPRGRTLPSRSPSRPSAATPSGDPVPPSQHQQGRAVPKDEAE